MKLQKPTIEMKNEYLDFIKEWDNNNESITPNAARLLDLSYEQWVSNLDIIENPKTCPDNLAAAHTYVLIDDNHKIIGAINIRHRLNEYLFNYGGHIGYGVRLSERKKGYAALMLSLALPIAKQLGINKVLITCDKQNIASAKTIQKNCGILENEVIVDNEVVQRYWIDL